MALFVRVAQSTHLLVQNLLDEMKASKMIHLWDFLESLREGDVSHPKYMICAMVKSRYIGDGHPTFNRNPYNGYINPYYWVDDHPLLYGNNGS